MMGSSRSKSIFMGKPESNLNGGDTSGVVRVTVTTTHRGGGGP